MSLNTAIALYNYTQPLIDFSEQALKDLLDSRVALSKLYEKIVSLQAITPEKIESLLQLCAEDSKDFMFYSNLVVKLIRAGTLQQLQPHKDRLIEVLQARLKRLNQEDNREFGLVSFDVDAWSSVSKFRVMCAENFLSETTQLSSVLKNSILKLASGEQEIITKEQCIGLLVECFSFAKQFSIQQFNDELELLEQDGYKEFTWILSGQSESIRTQIEHYFAEFTDEQLEAWVIQRVSRYVLNLAVKQIPVSDFLKKSLKALDNYGFRMEEIKKAFDQIERRCKEIV